jgi:hypothetical protein
LRQGKKAMQICDMEKTILQFMAGSIIFYKLF